ncbi:uncharacterized protein L3040_005667 [Drepanopeziza brunnea f. sp. 'multigermtubi']|uniref:uncharacterized protein n=1 Tax=Drepanopeziza brunnea f. sp. 'multigermtubi' TaxID=698441 RepID=UPI0023963A90|nr:hypothetical protein L3040_005667 [Drepanopeziza brunnea f. sp. 'multigermtubi']
MKPGKSITLHSIPARVRAILPNPKGFLTVRLLSSSTHSTFIKEPPATSNTPVSKSPTTSPNSQKHININFPSSPSPLEIISKQQTRQVTAFGDVDINYLSTSLSMKAKSPYIFVTRDNQNDYSPPAPPPPSPVNFPSESWSTACRR